MSDQEDHVSEWFEEASEWDAVDINPESLQGVELVKMPNRDAPVIRINLPTESGKPNTNPKKAIYIYNGSQLDLIRQVIMSDHITRLMDIVDKISGHNPNDYSKKDTLRI